MVKNSFIGFFSSIYEDESWEAVEWIWNCHCYWTFDKLSINK